MLVKLKACHCLSLVKLKACQITHCNSVQINLLIILCSLSVSHIQHYVISGWLCVTVLSPLSGFSLGLVTELWHSRFVMCTCLVCCEHMAVMLFPCAMCSPVNCLNPGHLVSSLLFNFACLINLLCFFPYLIPLCLQSCAGSLSCYSCSYCVLCPQSEFLL